MKRNIRMIGAALAAALLISQPALAAVGRGAYGGYSDPTLAPGTISSTSQNAEYVTAGPGVALSANPNAVNTGTAAPNTAGTANSGNAGGSQGSSLENPIYINGGTGASSGNTGSAAPTSDSAVQVNVSANVEKPEISSEAAVLYDASTGQLLYEKNGTKSMFPASTTKLMTALLTAENLSLDKTITLSRTAAEGLESGYSNAQLVTGDSITVKDALYAMMLKSACEVANGLAEAVGGSQANFASLMNQKAAALGCKNTHFANASGLNDASHTSCAYDMALITNAALNNATVAAVTKTVSYTLPASKERGKLTVTNGNKMIQNGSSEYYSAVIGGKTGYTSKAGNTLATAADISGHRLIAVVLKSNSKHYSDTRALYEYGKKLIAAGAAGTVQNNTAAGTEQTNTAAQNTAQAKGSWEDQKNGTWKYKKANGSYAANEWLDLDGKNYFFGSDSLMVTGWKQFSNGNWYYFDPQNGTMVRSKWIIDGQKSYYVQENGVLATNTVINGKYRVDANGLYVELVG